MLLAPKHTTCAPAGQPTAPKAADSTNTRKNAGCACRHLPVPRGAAVSTLCCLATIIARHPAGNIPQKHVWRARIVLLTVDGLGASEIMRRAGTSKVTVWRWQERFMRAEVEGLLRDKTRPSRIPPLPASVHERTVSLTIGDPRGEATHWTAATMAKAAGISVSSVQRIWRAHGLQPQRVRQFKLSRDPDFVPEAQSHRRPLCRSAGARDRAQHRREVADTGARSHPARAAAEAGALVDDEPRLQAQRHHHAVRRSRRARGQGHWPLHAAPPASGIHPLSRPRRRSARSSTSSLTTTGSHKHPKVRAWLGRTRSEVCGRWPPPPRFR